MTKKKRINVKEEEENEITDDEDDEEEGEIKDGAQARLMEGGADRDGKSLAEPSSIQETIAQRAHEALVSRRIHRGDGRK
jgi:hypothetical protein